MFEFLSHKSKELLGIDIGTKQIKMVELEREDKKAILKNYALVMIKGDSNLRQITPKEIANILKQALAKAQIKTKDTAMSLPAFSTFLALIKLENIPEKDEELEQIIQTQAKKYVPIPIDQVSLGWTRLNKEILLIAVPKNIVNKYGQIAKEAGLNLKALEAETFSLTRSLAPDEQEKAVIIDFGARSINISIVQQGKVRTNRTLESKDIEQAKQIIDPEIKKIILTGGRASEAKQKIMNSEIGNPWKTLKYPIALEQKLIELSPSFGVAVGLALRDFNG